MREKPQNNYVKDLLSLMPKNLSGKFFVANVYHEDNCPKLIGGACTCNADIVVEEADGIKDEQRQEPKQPWIPGTFSRKLKKEIKQMGK
jgi:hypothetical protein